TTGASWQSGSKVEFGPSRSASRRAEHFLVALLPSKHLLISAKHLLFEANRTSDGLPAHAMLNSEGARGRTEIGLSAMFPRSSSFGQVANKATYFVGTKRSGAAQ